MTVCNMSIEAGARAGMIAPDETTFAYLRPSRARPKARNGMPRSRAGAPSPRIPAPSFDASVDIDASTLEPMITYGTNPGMVLPIGAAIPDTAGDEVFDKALRLHGFSRRRCHARQAGGCGIHRQLHQRPARGYAGGGAHSQRPQSRAGRASAHRAGIARNQTRSGSGGYADIFKAAGADWRESGCSMCLGMNGDTVASGQYSISTSNRNFEGRQGVGARTLLVSPFTAAASAVRGLITDPREML